MKRVYTTLTIAALVVACAGVAQADNWTGLGDGTSFEDLANWDTTNALPGTTRTVSGAAFTNVTRDVDGTVNRMFVNNGAMVTIPSGTHSDSQTGSGTRNFVGRGSKGTIEQSGGSYDIGHMLSIGGGGANGDGAYYLKGGTLIASRGSNSIIDGSNPYGRPSLEISDEENAGSGLLEITGGTLQTRVGVGVGQTGTFSVLGSGADEIGIGSNGSIDGHWWQQSGGTLKVGVDSGGVTEILIDETTSAGSRVAIFEDGALLDVDYYDDGAGAGTWTVMTLENGSITNNGLAFAAGVDTGIWSFNIDNSGTDGILTVTAIPEPATLGLIGLAGLAIYAKRRFRS